jgi:hypothetical protein
MVDNKPTIALTKNLHDCSKHIDTRYHFIRDYVDGRGQIVLVFVLSRRQLAGIFTKPLGCVQFQELLESV